MNRREARSRFAARLRHRSVTGDLPGEGPASPVPENGSHDYGPAAIRRFSAVRIHVRELKLFGFTRSSGPRIADAFREELRRLVTSQGLPGAVSAGQSIDSLAAPSFHVSPTLPPEHVGAQMARSIWKGSAR